MRIVSAGLIVCLVVCLVATSVVAQTWNLQIVDNAGDVGYNSRIVTTSDDTPYVLYATSSEVRLAWWVPSGDSSGGWNSTPVGIHPTNTYRSLALRVDAHDDLHLAWGEYYVGSPSGCHLRYAIFDTETKSFAWGPEHVVTPVDDYTSYYPDLALVDSTGTITPTIVYLESRYLSPLTRHLKYATRNPGTGTWSFGVIYDAHRVGSQVSVAVDSNDGFHVSFYETDGNDLMYATKAAADTVWVASYVDVTGLVGSNSSIIVDDQDHPYIVYYDYTNRDLKYAKMITE